MNKNSPQSEGGKARSAKLSQDARSKIAKMGGLERWKGVPRSNKVTVAGKVDEDVLNRALAKWGSNKSDLIAKLIEDYAK